MTRHVVVVMSNAWKERHEEYNDWYDKVHIPDVLAVPGFVAAQRFTAGPPVLSEGVDASPYRYLSLYELETDDLPASLKALEAAMPTMAITKAIDVKGVAAYAYTATTDRVEGPEASSAVAAIGAVKGSGDR